jgi:hypothetical protein
MTESTARILAEWKGHTVHVRDLASLPGRVLVETVDGEKPFSKYYAGAGCSNDSDGCVFIDDLENCRVVDDSIEQDPFEPCDPPTEPEYDEYQEWQQMTSELRRGEA